MGENGPPGSDPFGARTMPWYILVLAGFVALNMFAMMALTFVDVVGRYFFNSPVPGGFEIVSFLLALLTFSGLALVTRDQEHISVGLLDGLFRGRAQRARELVILVGGSAMVGFIAERMWSEAEFLRRNNMYSEYLDVPLAPVQYAVAFLSAVAFLISLGIIWSRFRNRRDVQ